jgi:hypothetical protein
MHGPNGTPPCGVTEGRRDLPGAGSFLRAEQNRTRVLGEPVGCSRLGLPKFRSAPPRDPGEPRFSALAGALPELTDPTRRAVAEGAVVLDSRRSVRTVLHDHARQSTPGRCRGARHCPVRPPLALAPRPRSVNRDSSPWPRRSWSGRGCSAWCDGRAAGSDASVAGIALGRCLRARRCPWQLPSVSRATTVSPSG